MKEYLIIKTFEFIYFLDALPKDIKQRFVKKIDKIKYNPFIGKQLTYKWFRELKIYKFRVYYLIYEEEVMLLFISGSTKKNQQDTINYIKSNLSKYRNYLVKYKKNIKK